MNTTYVVYPTGTGVTPVLPTKTGVTPPVIPQGTGAAGKPSASGTGGQAPTGSPIVISNGAAMNGVSGSMIGLAIAGGIACML